MQMFLVGWWLSSWMIWLHRLFPSVLCRDLGVWSPRHTTDRKEKKEWRILPLKSLRQEVTTITSTLITLVRSSLMAALKYKGCWRCLKLHSYQPRTMLYQERGSMHFGWIAKYLCHRVESDWIITWNLDVWHFVNSGLAYTWDGRFKRNTVPDDSWKTRLHV